MGRAAQIGSCLAASLAGAMLLASCSESGAVGRSEFTALNPEWTVTPDEAYAWAQIKNANLPTLTGSPEWHNYMAFIEQQLRQFGVVDVTRNGWTFERWDTSDDEASWSLVSNGSPVRVAHYGAYSGSTGPEGITADLVYYDHDNPPASIEGKIVVIPTRPHPNPPYSDDYKINYTFNDYEYRTDDEQYLAPFVFIDPAYSFTFDIWWQLAQGLEQIPAKGNAAGAVIVYDMAYERTRGLYSFPVPRPYESPTLILDREAGAAVIADAKAGRRATLRLEATLEPAEAYQLIAYLPGRDYGTDQDEQIILTTHTDGPSITQENGAQGLLGIIKYFSHIPKQQRPRTLTVFLDCRHYLPGMEQAFKDQTWLKRVPEAREKIVGMVVVEGLGEMDYREADGRVEATGWAEQSYLWTRDNDLLIAHAIDALEQHGWSRAQLAVPERPGRHGGMQQLWWGVGGIGNRGDAARCDVWICLDVPSYGLGGFLGHYWSTAAGIERWNANQFVAQTLTMTQLTGVLMTADLAAIQPR